MPTQLITRSTTGGNNVSVKESPLTSFEVDSNFISLKNNKLEADQNLSDITDAVAARGALNVPSTNGSSAFGTWDISITGNAATASTLQNTVSINGVDFDGSEDVDVYPDLDDLDFSFLTFNSGQEDLSAALNGGIIMERGDEANKSFIWDESDDRWSFGDETVSAGIFEGDLTGNVTGDVTGDLTGNVTGNVTGDLTGNVTGDVTGDLTGNVTGNVNGTVSSLSNHNTNNLSEGSNLYFTTNRARNSVSASGDLSYNSSTGVFSFNERSVSEIRNLFSGGSGLSYNSNTGTFAVTQSPMPVGSTYVQFPGYTTPGNLFGGSWSSVFDDEGVFFRTSGLNARPFNSGIQGYKTERLWAAFDNEGSQDFRLRLVGSPAWTSTQYARDTRGDGSTQVSNTRRRGLDIIKGDRDLNVSDETRPINRTIRVWVRTS